MKQWVIIVLLLVVFLIVLKRRVSGLSSGGNTCTPCSAKAAGTYYTSQNGCATANCPAGMDSPATSSGSSSCVKTCPPGYFVNTTGGYSFCFQCGAGTYKSGTTIGDYSSCLSCPAGQSSPVGSTSSAACTSTQECILGTPGAWSFYGGCSELYKKRTIPITQRGNPPEKCRDAMYWLQGAYWDGVGDNIQQSMAATSQEDRTAAGCVGAAPPQEGDPCTTDENCGEWSAGLECGYWNVCAYRESGD
jgi:hypothetical protein